MNTKYRLAQLCSNQPDLLKHLDRLHRGLIKDEKTDADPQQFMDFVNQHLDDDTMLLTLCFTNTTPVGYIMAFDVSTHPFMPEWQRAGYITQIFVAEAYRHQQVGMTLFALTVAWLRQRGVQKVQLNISTSNALGEKFWERQGFKPVKTRLQKHI